MRFIIYHMRNDQYPSKYTELDETVQRTEPVTLDDLPFRCFDLYQSALWKAGDWLIIQPTQEPDDTQHYAQRPLPDEKKTSTTGEVGQISDGFHTFDELYQHRFALFVALAHLIAREYEGVHCSMKPWKSRLHSDGSSFPGYFLAGLGTEPKNQISYHFPDAAWELLRVPEREKAPDFDGHTSQMVIHRLLKLF